MLVTSIFIISFSTLFCLISVRAKNSPIPSLEFVDNFIPFELTYEVYKRWHHLPLDEKIPFLVDHFYFQTAKKEFLQLKNLEICSENDIYSTLIEDDFLIALAEFQDIKKIKSYFNNCDKDRDQCVNWEEFVVCRGFHDKFGNTNEKSEFDLLEDSLIFEFESRLRNPNDPMVLRLIESNQL